MSWSDLTKSLLILLCPWIPRKSTTIQSPLRWFSEIRVYSLLVVHMYYFKFHNFFLFSTVSLILLEVPSPQKIAVWYSIFITHRFLENYIYIDITKCMEKNKRGGMVEGVIFFYCWTLTKQKDFKYIVVLSKQKHTLWHNVSNACLNIQTPSASFSLIFGNEMVLLSHWFHVYCTAVY